ncbi:hypothetical protein [Gluconobacter roseus]|uniref:Uncharacterized protein n=1 Tax=Gluconobacter roseus NBRC 3990 TaxID=1307950 RepID=A0A4Y3M2R6_9PROT|nr:hypothetical protein [Gluconobacter roseus]GBR45095.1 hypothetical protein AA3990_0967 [Gluconobacter roseus NBRC 3990]GEB02844.1 hypothetical protein GRO01_04200 [Gluconobacter roseus NBRC 3990]GLP93303.1 hypothetical protein GCM10007871_12810 [Gluconobacter roseus NBRC 3990]
MKSEPSEYCFCVINARKSLKKLENNFYSALVLFDYFRSKMGLENFNDPKSNYQLSEVAARDAISTVYYFKKSLIQLANNVSLCNDTNGIVKIDLIHRAQELYEEYFPEAEFVRHGIAHASQAMATPGRSRSTSLNDNNINTDSQGPQVIIRSSFHGSVVTVTYQGKEYSADISKKSLKNLQEIRQMTVDAFGFDVNV